MANELYEPDNGERFSRNQVKGFMMFILGMTPCPENISRHLVSEVFKAYDDPDKPVKMLIESMDEPIQKEKH